VRDVRRHALRINPRLCARPDCEASDVVALHPAANATIPAIAPITIPVRILSQIPKISALPMSFVPFVMFYLNIATITALAATDVVMIHFQSERF
jgi:hypothetical protein